MEKPDISIIIPVYNEEKNVAILYREIRQALDPLDASCEILFIDDGSTDNTLQVLRDIKGEEKQSPPDNSFLRIIKFTRNFGQTAGMQAGFDQAKGEIIISMDGDLQNDPKDIPRFIDKLHGGYDVVCGWRKDRKDKALTRVIPSRAANWMIRKLTGVPIHDRGCSLKAFRSSVIKSVHLYSDMHRFIPAMTTTVGARITEIVVNHRPRSFGTTKYGLSRIWKVAFDMIAIKMLIHFSYTPLFWFGTLGSLFLLFGTGIGALSVFTYLSGEHSLVFFTASILSLFLFSSFLTWGFLADFFVRIEKNKRTIVSETRS